MGSTRPLRVRPSPAQHTELLFTRTQNARCQCLCRCQNCQWRHTSAHLCQCSNPSSAAAGTPCCSLAESRRSSLDPCRSSSPLQQGLGGGPPLQQRAHENWGWGFKTSRGGGVCAVFRARHCRDRGRRRRVGVYRGGRRRFKPQRPRCCAACREASRLQSGWRAVGQPQHAPAVVRKDPDIQQTRRRLEQRPRRRDKGFKGRRRMRRRRRRRRRFLSRPPTPRCYFSIL
jgi:hypothetical protein